MAPINQTVFTSHAIAEGNPHPIEASIGAQGVEPDLGVLRKNVTGEIAHRTGHLHDHQVGPVQKQRRYERRVPCVLANHGTDAPEARIEGFDARTPPEVARFVEHAVAGQIDLAVDMPELALLEVEPSDVLSMGGRFLDGADQNRHFTTGLRQAPQPRVFERKRDFAHHVLQQITRERELGKDQELDPGFACPGNPLLMELDVGVDVAQNDVALSQTDAHATGPLGEENTQLRRQSPGVRSTNTV